MPYNTFTLPQIIQDFELTIAEDPNLFAHAPPLQPSDLLIAQLQRGIPVARAIGTEKAKSEFVIAPILLDIKDRFSDQVSLFSGTNFNVLPERGLNGICDFLLSQSPQQLFIEAPVVVIVEAKDDSINSGLGQCVAEMLAAQIFNGRRGMGDLTVSGAVTNSSNWRFLRLQNQHVAIGPEEVLFNQVDRILGILAVAITKKDSFE